MDPSENCLAASQPLTEQAPGAPAEAGAPTAEKAHPAVLLSQRMDMVHSVASYGG